MTHSPPTANARESVAMNMAELHDAAGNMEFGRPLHLARRAGHDDADRVQQRHPDSAVARLRDPAQRDDSQREVIPIDAPHADPKVKLWGRRPARPLGREHPGRRIHELQGGQEHARSECGDAVQTVGAAAHHRAVHARRSGTSCVIRSRCGTTRPTPRPGPPPSRSTAMTSICSSSTPATRGTTRCRTRSAVLARRKRGGNGAAVSFFLQLQEVHMRSRVCLTMFACIAVSLAFVSPAPAQIENVTPVTDEMLRNPDPGDWLSWRRTLDGWGYSPLDDVNASNVGDLRLAWSWGSSPGCRRRHQWCTTASCISRTRATWCRRSTRAPATSSGSIATRWMSAAGPARRCGASPSTRTSSS